MKKFLIVYPDLMDEEPEIPVETEDSEINELIQKNVSNIFFDYPRYSGGKGSRNKRGRRCMRKKPYSPPHYEESNRMGVKMREIGRNPFYLESNTENLEEIVAARKDEDVFYEDEELTVTMKDVKEAYRDIEDYIP